MTNLLQDVQYAIRRLRKSPGFLFVAVLSLTMAIAANVVVFGVLNALVLHPLPVPDPGRVFQIEDGSTKNFSTFSYPNYRDIRDRNTTFSGMATYRFARIGLELEGKGEAAKPAWAYLATGNYFDALGVQPLLGRFFHASDEVKVNGSPYVVLSYACWKGRFSGDMGIAGKTIHMNKHPYTVLGVAPQEFHGTERVVWPEMWVPMMNGPELNGWNPLEERGDSNLWIIGRLKPGVSPEQADADLNRVAAQLAKEYPNIDRNLTLHVTQPGYLGDAMGGPTKAFLYGVMLLAGLVLLAASANLGGLFAAHTADRAREFGIRLAVGSSRIRILRELMTESVLVAALSGAVAAFLSRGLLQAITHLKHTVDLPVEFLVTPGPTVYAVAVLLSLFTGLLFGVIPAQQIWKTDPNQTLKASGASNYASRRFTLRDILLAVQIALCCLLVTAAFVSLRGLQRTFKTPMGIDPGQVTVATLDLHLAGYAGDDQLHAVQEKLLHALKQIQGVTAASYSNTTPLSIDQNRKGIFAPGATEFTAATRKFGANYYEISPDYFLAAGTRLLAGRAFTEHDDDHAPKVAIVNQTFAKKLFGTENAVGLHYPYDPGIQIEVVGVVADGKYATLTEDPTPAVYLPMQQNYDSDLALLVRSSRSSAEMIPAIRQAIASVDKGLPVFSLQSWTDALGMVTFPARAATIALGVLGALAMMLAITGIFGLASYTVSRRMRELGIRVALGAQNQQVLRAALGRTVLLLGIGSIAGLLLGAAASRVLASIVYQASASDPLVLLAVTLTMLLIGLISAVLPARRAVSVEPAMLLRDE